ncbi:hypothetical protein C366_04315 [Cryptococcus neoformans Tu401-1]|nr:hypothetical protein C365_06131 [Cryptococcus neoformans var. grubii Bt85]OXG15723.1 hypothetical protein C366_04315 [Cryptococcus neoformans var. grubii Tu401-1]OXM78360.1 hypothetical protein C364_04299 [Cryptococcus neoformans var. grubii Bt63]
MRRKPRNLGTMSCARPFWKTLSSNRAISPSSTLSRLVSGITGTSEAGNTSPASRKVLPVDAETLWNLKSEGSQSWYEALRTGDWGAAIREKEVS